MRVQEIKTRYLPESIPVQPTEWQVGSFSFFNHNLIKPVFRDELFNIRDLAPLYLSEMSRHFYTIRD